MNFKVIILTGLLAGLMVEQAAIGATCQKQYDSARTKLNFSVNVRCAAWGGAPAAVVGLPSSATISSKRLPDDGPIICTASNLVEVSLNSSRYKGPLGPGVHTMCNATLKWALHKGFWGGRQAFFGSPKLVQCTLC